MSSLSNIEEHVQEQPVKKRRVDNLEEKSEKTKPTEVNLPKTTEADKNKELEMETSTTMVDLPPSVDRHRQLPAELNCQIFYCLNLPTRRKFISGLGWDFYAMFRHGLLIKTKRLCNPPRNRWSKSDGDVTISEDGLNFTSNNTNGQHIYAEKGFPISVADCRVDDFPGTICYYYEVKSLSAERCVFGLINGGYGIIFADPPNPGRYAISTKSTDGHLGDFQFSELPVEARSKSNAQGNVYGCGLLMHPDNQLIIFFTFNGILLGKQIPISPSADRLFPAVYIRGNMSTLEANFGDDKDKPFEYDIKNYPGMGLDCI